LRLASLAFFLGFFSLACQTLVFREHLLVYSGNELGAGVFFGSWMLWIAVGAVAGRFGPLQRPVVHALLLLSYPVAFAAQLYFTWSLRDFAQVASTELFPLVDLVLWTFVAGFPVSFCTGLLFTATARRLTRESGVGAGRGAATVYGLEALGSLAAGGAVTVALLLGAPTPYLLVSVCLLWEVGAAWFSFSRRLSVAACVHGAVAALVVIGLATGLPDALERTRRQALPVPAGMEIIESIDTPYRNVTVARAGTATVLFSNGEMASFMPDRIGAANRAAVLYAMHPRASRILVLGLGAESLVCQLARGPAAELVYVGVDYVFSRVVSRHSPPELTRCLSDPRVKLTVEDPRRFLAAGNDPALFDLVILAAGEPRTAGAARFYSLEFFEQVKARLAPDGVFALQITVTENVLRGAALLYAGAVYSTLAVAFAEVEITGGESMGIFASPNRGVVSSDPDELATRFAPLAHYFPEFPETAFATLFENARIKGRKEALERGSVASVSRDVAPSVFLLSLLAAHSRSELLPLVAKARRGAEPVFLGILLALILAVFLSPGRGARERGRFLPGFAIFAAGFSAMAGQLVIVLGYQAAFGSLFAEFGLLNGTFMLGLFIGSFVLGRLISGRRAPLISSAGLALALGAGWLFVGAEPEVSEWLRRACFGASLALGMWTGWTLAAATAELEDSGLGAGGAAAYLEGLDHLGAMVGGLVCGLVFVPLLGLDTALLLSAGLVATGLALRVTKLVVGSGRGIQARLPVPALPIRNLLLFIVLATGCCALLLWNEARSTGSGQPLHRGHGASVRVDTGTAESTTGPREGDLTVSSFQFAPEVEGWAGPMELLVTLDPNERVVGVRLGRHLETPEYVYGIDRWFATFKGLDAVSLRHGGEKGAAVVDALTGATVTGVASVEIVRRVGRELRRLRTGETPPEALPPASARASPPTSTSLLPWLAALLLAVTGAAFYLSGRWRPRLVLLVAVVAVGGVMWNFQLGFDTAAMLLGGVVPPWSNVMLWVVLAGAGATLVLFGPLYCGSLCPFGAATELVSIAGLKWRPSVSTDRRLRSVKYALALLLLAFFVAWPSRSLFSFDPLAFAFRFHWDPAAGAMLALVAAGSFLYYRFWCRYLCPLGALLSLFEKVALLARLSPVRRSAECHVGVLAGQDLDCLRCNRCVALAPPLPRLAPARGRDAIVVVMVVAVVAAGGARVVSKWTRPAASVSPPVEATVTPREPRSQAAPEKLWSDPAAAAEGMCLVPAGDGTGDLGAPRLYRKDDKQYEFQRNVDLDRLRRLLESGRLSGREADYFIPLEPGVN